MSLVNGNKRVMRGVVRILMQSPIYMRMPLGERKLLVLKLCAQMGVPCESMSSRVHNSASLLTLTLEEIPSQSTPLTSDLN